MTDDAIGLERLDQTQLTLADGERDIRGWPVVASDGEEIGSVKALYVDPDKQEVRFLQVASGGVLGFGEEDHLVPIDAIESLDGERVRLSQDRTRVAGSPAYDPALVEDPDYWEGVYGWYGYPPYWSTAFPMTGAYLPQLGYPPLGTDRPDREPAPAGRGRASPEDTDRR